MYNTKSEVAHDCGKKASSKSIRCYLSKLPSQRLMPVLLRPLHAPLLVHGIDVVSLIARYFLKRVMTRRYGLQPLQVTLRRRYYNHLSATSIPQRTVAVVLRMSWLRRCSTSILSFSGRIGLSNK